MRTNVTPFLFAVASAVFAVVWRNQDKPVFGLLALVLAIAAIRSYSNANKRQSQH